MLAPALAARALAVGRHSSCTQQLQSLLLRTKSQPCSCLWQALPPHGGLLLHSSVGAAAAAAGAAQKTEPCFLPLPSIMSFASFTLAAMKLLPPAHRQRHHQKQV
jgi:hypothetical protein